MSAEIHTVDCTKYKCSGDLAAALRMGEIKLPVWLKFDSDGYLVTPENMRAFVHGIYMATNFQFRKQIEQI